MSECGRPGPERHARRAVHGTGLGPPGGLDLEDGRRDLPLAVSLAERAPVVGAAGAGLRRKAPHLACLDFLPALGQPREWAAGRHRLDAGRRPRPRLPTPVPVARPGGRRLPDAADVPHRRPGSPGPPDWPARSTWPLLGTTAAPTAAALAAYERLPWSGLALVADVDGHALTWSAVSVEADHVQLVQTHVCPHLDLGAWLLRLLNGAAGRCVRHEPARPARLGRRRADAVRPAGGPAGHGRRLGRHGGAGHPGAAVVSEPDAALRRTDRVLRPAGAAGGRRDAGLRRRDGRARHRQPQCWRPRRPAPCPA